MQESRDHPESPQVFKFVNSLQSPFWISLLYHPRQDQAQLKGISGQNGPEDSIRQRHGTRFLHPSLSLSLSTLMDAGTRSTCLAYHYAINASREHDVVGDSSLDTRHNPNPNGDGRKCHLISCLSSTAPPHPSRLSFICCALSLLDVGRSFRRIKPSQSTLVRGCWSTGAQET